MTDLTEAARAAQILDTDVLRMARADLPPGEAVADLRARFPTAFGKRFVDMSSVERKDFERANGLRRTWA